MSVETKLNELDLVDVGIFRHGFTPYMRDYFLEYEVGGTTAHAGRYLCLFTHCVIAHVETRVEDAVWRRSWQDDFIDYQAWLDAGEPEGFVWGTNWSLAYPGLQYIRDSKLAASWSEKLKEEMHEVTIETESFRIQLIFHDVKVEKLSSDVGMVNKVIFPLK
jgi:hypothetical protein